VLLRVGANPGSAQFGLASRLREENRSGADYIVTADVFDLRQIEESCRRTEPIYKIPLIARQLASHQLRPCRFMRAELRVPVLEKYRDTHAREKNAEAAVPKGVAIAQDMVKAVRPMTCVYS